MRLDEFIKEVHEKKIRNFPLILDGQSWGKTKIRDARLSIAIPSSVIGEDLCDKDKWWWRIIVVEKEEAERVFKKFRENEPKK